MTGTFIIATIGYGVISILALPVGIGLATHIWRQDMNGERFFGAIICTVLLLGMAVLVRRLTGM